MTYDALIARLEAAKHPDGKLDRDILTALGAIRECDHAGKLSWPDGAILADDNITGDVNSALAVVRLRFPKSQCALVAHEDICTAYVAPTIRIMDTIDFAHARTAPIAVCLALLHAERKRDIAKAHSND